MGITVLGVGNPIMGDDAIGLELLKKIPPVPGVELIDGGTSGLEILPVIQDAEDLLILDALAGPGEAGTVHTLLGDQIPRLLQAKLSPHQVGLLDLLSMARLVGSEPRRIAVVGIVAGSVDLRVGLSPACAAALPAAARAAAQLVTQWHGDDRP